MAEARNSKFGTQINRQVPYRKKNKNFRQKGSPGGHVPILGTFGTPSISRQRLKLETSYVARRPTASCARWKSKIGSKGVVRELCDLLLDILGYHPYLRTG